MSPIVFPFADVTTEGWTAIGLGVSGLLSGVAGIVVALRKERREDNAAIFGQYQAIVADLRKRVGELEAGHDRCDQERAALQKRVERLEELAERCRAADCPLAGAFAARPFERGADK